MAQQLSASEQLAFTTIRIQCETVSGTTSIGTGFFFSFKFDGDKFVPVIITNHHVITNSKRGIFQLTRVNADGTPQIGVFDNIVIDDFEKSWHPHPNPDVDLCMMLVGPLFHEAEKQGKLFFFKQLNEELIPSQQLIDDLTALEEVLMIGYPVGLWDSANNMPIFRKGITATHPNMNYEGREDFLIDAACFPGSSGSPVFLCNLGNWTDRMGTTNIGTRIALLGILYAGPQYTVEGELKVLPIPTQMIPVPLSKIPINLGMVIKAKRILDFRPILTNLLAGG